MTNLFVTFLRLLKVKHTESFSGRYYNEHPHKHELYGLSSMLSDYGIENKGLKLNDKQNDLALLTTPFIAHIGNDFVIVHKNTPEKIDYIRRDKNISVTVDEFIKTWSGIILLAEPSETSSEPGYERHRQKEVYKSLGKYLFMLLSSLCIGILYVSHQLFQNWGLSSLLLINLIGIYVCSLLIMKQMKIHENYADKICTLFKQGDCNTILESGSAKLWGIIGWSEIGFGYFISNAIILLCFPHLVSFLAIFNICTLPYTIWSIGYQKKAKQWCPLCLIVQCLLWGIFAIDSFAGFIQLPLLNITDLLWVSCVYLMPVLSVYLLLPKLSESIRVKDIKQEINRLKANEDIFLILLKKQPHYRVNKDDSRILFGNPESRIHLTILTNPHCTPCAKLHAKIERLLVDTKNKFCIRYIFASSSEELEASSQFLINTYHNYTDQALQIFNEWFDRGKFQKEAMFAKYNINLGKHNQEYVSHKLWREKYQLVETPTVLLNGYRLPDNYKIEDLRFITEFNIDIK